MNGSQRELLDTILNEISVEEAFSHLTWLNENVGERLSISKERKAAEYFMDRLEQYGVPVEIHEWDTYVSLPSEAELTVTSPEKHDIEAKAYAFSPPTPPEGVEGELVYVGHGALEDYKDVDVKDKIVFVRFSFTPIYNEKIRIAEGKGAKALIVMNWTRPDQRIYHYGIAKHVWGTPTRKMLEDPTPNSFTHIPAICIVREDGEKLLDLCKRQPVTVRVKAETSSEWRKVFEPVAHVEGGIEPEKFVLIGGHYDAFGSGTTDNATGNALLLELARIFNKHKSKLRRSIRFAWWPGHETAKQAGSTWYLDNFWDDINDNGIVYINCDSPGMKGTVRYSAYSFVELRAFFEETVKQVLGEDEEIVEFRPPKWGDQSFWGLGLPSIDGRSTFPKDYEYGAFGGWYHSKEDTPDKVSIDRYEKDIKVYAATILNLCNSVILPVNPTVVADEFVETLTELQGKGKNHLDLSTLISKAEALKLESQRMMSTINKLGEEKANDETVNAINSSLMRYSRILTPANYGLASKYEQDLWGDSRCTMPIARLRPVAELANLNPESGEYKALKTELTRERNMVSDALGDALSLIRRAARELEKCAK